MVCLALERLYKIFLFLKKSLSGELIYLGLELSNTLPPNPTIFPYSFVIGKISLL